MANFIVVYDACVFYPAPLRDLLIRLAMTRRFRARWTTKIHEEWTRNLLANRKDLTQQQLDRAVANINKAVEDCLINGYEHLIEGLKLPDPNDPHVLAAAIRAGAAAIVTMNLKDFPDEALNEFEIFAHTQMTSFSTWQTWSHRFSNVSPRNNGQIFVTRQFPQKIL